MYTLAVPHSQYLTKVIDLTPNFVAIRWKGEVELVHKSEVEGTVPQVGDDVYFDGLKLRSCSLSDEIVPSGCSEVQLEL